MLQDQTAGDPSPSGAALGSRSDPMQVNVKWTNLSRRTIARLVSELGTPVTRGTVGLWLKANNFCRRQTQKKKTMGSHLNRDKQFQRIAALKQAYKEGGDPVISIDSKKKELLGDFHRSGKLECQAVILVNDRNYSGGVG